MVFCGQGSISTYVIAFPSRCSWKSYTPQTVRRMQQTHIACFVSGRHGWTSKCPSEKTEPELCTVTTFCSSSLLVILAWLFTGMAIVSGKRQAEALDTFCLRSVSFDEATTGIVMESFATMNAPQAIPVTHTSMAAKDQ